MMCSNTNISVNVNAESSSHFSEKFGRCGLTCPRFAYQQNKGTKFQKNETRNLNKVNPEAS